MKIDQHLKSLSATIFALLLTLGLSACGGGGGGGDNAGPSNSGTESPDALTGFAQKGPLQAGGTVTLEPVNSDGTLVGQSLAVTLDGLGGYSIDLDKITWEGPTLITARSPYFNENKGVYENSVIGNGLQVIADLPAESKVNINLFTHLVASRTRHLMENDNQLFSTARIQARDELVTLLTSGAEAWPIPVSSDINPMRLNLLDREKVQFTNYLSAEQDSVSLLLFSSALLTVLDNPDWDSTPGGVGGGSSSDGVDKATGDFSDDGLLNGEGKDLLDKMKTATDKAGEKISKATKNLKEKFNKLELFPEVPNIDPQEAAEALKDVLADRYLEPEIESGRSLDDYIQTHVSNGYVRVSVGLDSKGRLVPNEDWHAANGDYCRVRARYAAQAVETLVFKVYLTSEVDLSGTTRDQYYMFAQILDSETSRIQAQQEGGVSAMYQAGFEVPEGETPHRDTLAIGMERALDGLKYAKTNVSAEPKAPASSPCGEIRLVHVSGSEVGEYITFMTGFEGVDTPGLTYGYLFGDGTSEDPAPRTTSHIYSEKGTYTVDVYVRGTVDGEDVSGNQTTQVEIGSSEYTLHFDSYFNYELNTDDGGYIHSHSQYSVDVPLTRGQDGTYQGAKLMDLLQKPDIYSPNITIVVPDGPRPNIWVWATIPADKSIDTLDVRLCFDPNQLQAAGAFAPGTMWGGMFLQAHQSKLEGVPLESGCPANSWKFRFADWNASAADDIFAEKTWNRIVDTGQPTQERTYIKVLKKN